MSTQANLGLPTDTDSLLETRGTEYIPDVFPIGYPYNRNRPLFSSFFIEEMLADPRLVYALWLLKGPILSNAKFEYQCSRTDIQQFMEDIMKRFWRNDACKALKAIEWGFQGAEVIRTVREGRITFDSLLDFHPRDIRVVTNYGQFSGVTVNNVPFCNMEKKKKIYLGGAKAFLHTHWREKHPWYGLSRFYGAFIPWWEIWTNGGFRDVRRLWFFKNAYEGGTMYHPPGSTKIGNINVPNKVLADELITKKRAGGTLSLQSGIDGNGQPLWKYESPVGNPVPTGLLEYGKLLNDEELEGLGIPPEVIESGGDQGFGSATGRQIPQTAFYAILQELIQALVSDIMRYIIRPDIALNFGEDEARKVEIIPMPLGGEGQQQAKPGDQGDFSGNQFVDENNQSPDVIRPDKLDEPVSMSVEPAPNSPPKESGRWITIGGHSEDGKQHKGGFPVQINANGQIIAGGPPKMKGVHLSRVGEYFDKQKEQLEKTKADKFSEVSDFFDDITNARKSKEEPKGAAPGSTRSLTKIIAYQADKWGMPPEVYADIMDEMEHDIIELSRKREEVKKEMRERSGYAKGKVSRLAGVGQDHRSLEGFDTLAQDFAANYPDLFTSGDAEEDAWELLKEGAKKAPTKTSREFHEAIDKELEKRMTQTGAKFNPYTPMKEPESTSAPDPLWG